MELVHTCYRITDIDRSVAFYEALGFEERARMPIRDEAINVFMGLPGDADRLELTPERVLEIQASSRQPVSLETPLGNEDSAGTLGDLIADRSVRSPHEMAAHSMLRRHMDDAMQVLPPRERQVLRLRYGLSGGREHTLGEIADQLGVTSERVRQIESAALSKLRQPKLRHKLREYLDEYAA